MWPQITAGGRTPPHRRDGRGGSNGRIFSHWASVKSQPYLVIGPTSGVNYSREPPPRENNYLNSILLYRVLKWLVSILRQSRRKNSEPLKAAAGALSRPRKTIVE